MMTLSDQSIFSIYDPAMRILDQAEADAYFEILVAHTMETTGKTRAEAEEVERKNLGYFAGYYDDLTRERVERLFRCSHPYFGAIADQGPPTIVKAFVLGYEAGRKIRDGEPPP